jgi:hypothetical protein
MNNVTSSITFGTGSGYDTPVFWTAFADTGIPASHAFWITGVTTQVPADKFGTPLDVSIVIQQAYPYNVGGNWIVVCTCSIELLTGHGSLQLLTPPFPVLDELFKVYYTSMPGFVY